MHCRAPLLLMLATSALAAPADIQDIRGPLPAAAGLPPFFLTALLLLLVGALWFFRRRRSAAPPPAAPDARELLARLVVDYRQGACDSEQVVLRLDGILRRALAAITGIPAPWRTTAELRALLITRLDAEQTASLDKLLSLCDQTKFAGHRPDGHEVDWALDVSAGLIDGLPTMPS
jgi:hypothetical protein